MTAREAEAEAAMENGQEASPSSSASSSKESAAGVEGESPPPARSVWTDEEEADEAGEDYEEGHRAAFDHTAAYARELAALSHPLLVMNINDDLVSQTRRVDALLANGERRDYPDWGNGFLELWPEAVAAELLAFLDADRDPGVQSASATS